MKDRNEKQQEILSNIPKQYKDIVLLAIEYTHKKFPSEKRYSGDLLFDHLLETALLTTQVGLDINSTIAGLFHEMRFNDEERKYVSKTFGDEVVEIVDRILEVRNSTNTTDTPNEIIIKYILSSSKDLRPIIIKILDKLDDMRSIESVPIEERKLALSKALEIYSVLAEYIDLNEIKKEMEENAFKQQLPNEYKSITKKLEEENIDEKLLKKYKTTIWDDIKNLPFKKDIKGRIKSKYSIYNKLKKYEKEWISPNITKVPDLIAFRIITDTEDSCYSILEKLMDNGNLNYDLFDDYISNPKPNGYKAVQFPITFPSISPLEIEIQIMTDDMYYFNTYGPASHIAYKASKSRYAKPTNKYQWVEEINNQMQLCIKNRNTERNIPIKCSIFQDEVFAFTPKGKILDLVKGDTVLDFAFKLHTQIGNSAVSAVVNGRPAKISSTLNTGDTVEIKTDHSKKYQKIEALRYVNSLTSKFRIRNQLSKFNRKD